MHHKQGSQLNKFKLLRQIAWLSYIDKSSSYWNLITENSNDPKKLLDSLRKVLYHVLEATLPVHISDEKLAQEITSFFEGKI